MVGPSMIMGSAKVRQTPESQVCLDRSLAQGGLVEFELMMVSGV